MLIKTVLASLGIALIMPSIAFAHVVVTPGQAGVGEELIFNVSVPNEQQTAVTNVRLLIPSGVTNVTPTVKNGWTITTTTNGDAKAPEVTAISWSDGTVPVGQRDDFSFSAQVPASAGDVDWKAYQTYADGTVVHWDQKPAGSDDSTGNAGPYSVTHVTNDLTAPVAKTASSSSGNTALIISLVAIVLSALALTARRNKKA